MHKDNFEEVSYCKSHKTKLNLFSRQKKILKFLNIRNYVYYQYCFNVAVQLTWLIPQACLNCYKINSDSMKPFKSLAKIHFISF